MKNMMRLAGCAAVVLSIGPFAVRAQDDVGAMKTQLQGLRQKIAEREKAILASPAVVAAKQAADAAAAARKQFETGNAVYAQVSKAKEDAQAAYNKAAADALAKDEQYVAAKTQMDELGRKANEPRDKLKTATPEQRPALEAEIAALKAQAEPFKKTVEERKKAVEALPEVVAAKKAVADARAAKDGFATVNSDYGKLVAAEKEARSAFDKARNDAEAADAERTALQQQMRDLQKKIEAAASK